MAKQTRFFNASRDRRESLVQPGTRTQRLLLQVTARPILSNAEIPDEKYPAHTYYGDGSDIEPEVIQHIRATSWACAVGFRWRRGDLLAMDNLTVQHARIGFTCPRKILTFLVA